MIALKIIRRELAGNRGILDRFKQELILATQVTHRNVVRIYDLGEAEGIKFITMEYVEGEDLACPYPSTEASYLRTRRSDIVSSRCAGRWRPRTAVGRHPPRPEAAEHHAGYQGTGRILVMDFGLARRPSKATA